jgi:hypothetical protein
LAQAACGRERGRGFLGGLVEQHVKRAQHDQQHRGDQHVITEQRAKQAVDLAGDDSVQHDRRPRAHHGGGREKGNLAGERVHHGFSE